MKKIVISFVCVLLVLSFSVFGMGASAATVNTNYTAVSYNHRNGTTKPVTNDYWVTAKKSSTTTFTVKACFPNAKLCKKADSGCDPEKALSLLKFDVYLTEVATGKTVQAYYYRSSGFNFKIPKGGKNYYVTVVSYFSNYKTAKNVNYTMASNIKYYATKK